MLRNYCQNKELQLREENTIHDFSSNLFARNIVELSQSPYFQHVDWGQYADFNQFLIAAITKADCDELESIYEVFSKSPVLSNLPTINHLREQQSKANVRKIFAKLIQYLSWSFEMPTTKAIRSVSNVFMNKFGGFTVLDAIVFIEECKERMYCNGFHHLTNKGITPEYLLIWIDEFIEKKVEREEEERLSFRIKGNLWIQHLPAYQLKSLDKFVVSPAKKTKIEKDAYDKKYDELKARHRELQNEKGLGYQLVEAHAFKVLKFDIENIHLSDEELFAKAKIDCKKIVEDLRQNLDCVEVKDDSINLPKAINGVLFKIESEYRNLTCPAIFNGCFKKMDELNISVEGLDVYWCMNRLFPKWSYQYPSYFRRELDNDVLPYDKETYLKMMAIQWLKKQLATSKTTP